MPRPRLTACSDAIQRCASGEGHVRAQRQRLHHIGTATDTAVEHNQLVRPHRSTDFRQHVDRRLRAVELASAMVRDKHTVCTVLHRQACILGMQHALDKKFVRPDFTQPLEVAPVERIALLTKLTKIGGNDAATNIDIGILKTRHP